MNAALVVSIGTTHPRNTAGLGLDARIAAEYGVTHAMAVAAVSAQDARGVHAVFPVPREVLLAQLGAIDFTAVAAVRIGALGSEKNAAAAGEFLQRYALVPAVFDPVMHASAGGSLYLGDALDAVAAFNARVRAIVTPNIAEARALTGREIDTPDDMAAAGKELVERGARAALVKGGHLAGDPVDVLVTEGGVETFEDTRLPQKMRGTGCTLAMALACELALGRDLVAAVRGARTCVRTNMARS